MSSELSLYWLARLTAAVYERHGGTASEDGIAKELEQTVGQTVALLEGARQAGFIDGGRGRWTLTKSGSTVGRQVAEAYDKAERGLPTLRYRPYTDFLPTGREKLE